MALDLTDQLRIAAETPDTIRARLIADTNATGDPTDTTIGSIWDDLNGAAALELDRVYDRFNEVAAAAIPALTFGAFLDAWAASVGLERLDATAAAGAVTFTGTAGTVIPTGAQVSTPQTSPDTEPVTFQATSGATISGGSVDLTVVAVDVGAQGNVPAGTVTNLDTPISGVSVTNSSAITGGSDVETDEHLQARLLRKLGAPAGGGNAAYYLNLALNTPGVGFATVQPNTPSVGHVAVVITDVNNDPAPSTLVAALQAALDPSGSASQGAGQAAIGATVTVSTPTSLAITVAAKVILDAGFSLDGSTGTFAVGDAIEASVARYVNRLPVGGDVLRNKVIAAFVDVTGVQDVVTSGTGALTINGGSGDVAVSATQVASLVTPLTLTT
jgi:uncharacterized phage protein gp47/JayE